MTQTVVQKQYETENNIMITVSVAYM